jgi:3-oxoacyl-[acyl-carrier-protein] synthase II
MRPFDASRDGLVIGEGAAVFILESHRHAKRRGATILARLLGWASAYEPVRNGTLAGRDALKRAVILALQNAGLTDKDVGHVNAHGASTVDHDRLEAQAIREVLPDVPVTAPKGFFGSLEAASGAMELAASVLAFRSGAVPVTLNYKEPDPECPLDVIHGDPRTRLPGVAVALNWTGFGQASAVVAGGPVDDV